MINKLRILSIIPARGGSKGIKNKNIKLVNGKPLIAYTIEAALNCKYIDRVIVSTDSKRIAKISRKFGAEVPFLRPSVLAKDDSRTIDSIIYTINKLENKYDILVILQPTSPLRNSKDIKSAIEFFLKYKKSLASINPIEINPFLIRTLNNVTLNRLIPCYSTIRRQDLGKYYKINGAIYINYISKLNLNTSLNDNEIGFVMENFHSIDVDTYKDLLEVKNRLKSIK